MKTLHKQMFKEKYAVWTCWIFLFLVRETC